MFFDLVLMYKIIKGLSDICFSDFFCLNQNPYSLRGNTTKIVCKRKFNTKQLNSCFFARVVGLWNLLPHEVSSAPSLPIFKKMLNDLDFKLLVSKYV